MRGKRSVRLGGQELPLDSPVLAAAQAAERAEYLRRRAEMAPLPLPAQRSSVGEAAWQRQVVEVARRLRYYVYHPHLSRWSERGWPDLSLLHEQRRRALWLELKDDHKHLTEAQVEVIAMMRACGLEVHVLRPWHGLEQVEAILTER